MAKLQAVALLIFQSWKLRAFCFGCGSFGDARTPTSLFNSLTTAISSPSARTAAPQNHSSSARGHEGSFSCKFLILATPGTLPCC